MSTTMITGGRRKPIRADLRDVRERKTRGFTVMPPGLTPPEPSAWSKKAAGLMISTVMTGKQYRSRRELSITFDAHFK